MCGVLALLFVAVPIVEIWVILKVGSLIGALPTVGIIVVTAVSGAALARHQGFAALRQLQEAMAAGRKVGRALVEAALVLVAGIMLLTPGFVTDGIGLALLLPPVRAWVAARLARWAEGRAMDQAHVFWSPGRPPGPGEPEEREEREERDEDPPPPGVIDV